MSAENIIHGNKSDINASCIPCRHQRQKLRPFPSARFDSINRASSKQRQETADSHKATHIPCTYHIPASLLQKHDTQKHLYQNLPDNNSHITRESSFPLKCLQSVWSDQRLLQARETQASQVRHKSMIRSLFVCSNVYNTAWVMENNVTVCS